jgi:Tol biopolymer transport system component
MIAVAVPVVAAMAATGTTTAISFPPTPVSGEFASNTPSVSGDGRYVAFQTSVSTFVAGDTDGTGDVVLYDREDGSYERISARPDGTQAGGFQASVSDSGRFVAFATYDSMAARRLVRGP